MTTIRKSLAVLSALILAAPFYLANMQPRVLAAATTMMATTGTSGITKAFTRPVERAWPEEVQLARSARRPLSAATDFCARA